MPKPTLFVVTDELQQVLDQLPLDQQRSSQLEPLKTFIMRWRRQGRTYRRIAEILTTQCKLPISHVAVRKFVKRCARPRKQEPELEAQSEQPGYSPEPKPAIPGKRLTPEERAAQVAYIRSLNKPALQEQPAKPRWNLDVDKPRTIHKP
jgi:hypothetical protein